MIAGYIDDEGKLHRNLSIDKRFEVYKITDQFEDTTYRVEYVVPTKMSRHTVEWYSGGKQLFKKSLRKNKKKK